MISARRYFRLRPTASDAELIGVPEGSRRDQVLEATGFLFESVARNSSLSAEDSRAIEMEIREAAERLLAGPTPPSPPGLPISKVGTEKEGRGLDSIFGMILMRRYPRRAGMTFALMHGFEPRPAPLAVPGTGAVADEGPMALNEEEKRRVPWILAALVLAFFAAVVVEVQLARKQLKFAMARRAAETATKVLGIPAESSPDAYSIADPASEPEIPVPAPGPAKRTATPSSSGVSAATVTASSPVPQVPGPTREEPAEEIAANKNSRDPSRCLIAGAGSSGRRRSFLSTKADPRRTIPPIHWRLRSGRSFSWID